MEFEDTQDFHIPQLLFLMPMILYESRTSLSQCSSLEVLRCAGKFCLIWYQYSLQFAQFFFLIPPSPFFSCSPSLSWITSTTSVIIPDHQTSLGAGSGMITLHLHEIWHRRSPARM
jgi:hypothetical protein